MAVAVTLVDAAGNVSSPALVGNVAAGAADSGNPVKIGGIYRTTPPVMSNLTRGDAQLDVSANLRVLASGQLVTGADGMVNTNLLALGNSASQTASLKGLAVSGFVFNGTSWDRMRGNATEGQVVRPYALAAAEWAYAAAALGIVNSTTAITIKAAGGGAVVNYITSIEIQCETLATASEFVIRNGAAGAVLWRCKLGTTALPLTHITFSNPLKSSANTLLEIAMITASATGAVYFNAQGYAV